MSAPGRRWLELRARCPSGGAAAALLADALLGLGGRAVEERDGWWATHLEAPGDIDSFVPHARNELAAATGLSGIELQAVLREHEDWAETWKRGLSVRRISERIVVRPSWLEPTGAGADDVVVVLDPGVAFGTAEHGTTRGCLRLLDRVVAPGDRVLDVGAGSGILSVAAAKLGAVEVVALEGDHLACEALVENVARNAAGDRVRIEDAWADADRLRGYEPFSGVVANLERGLLLPLLGGLREAVRPGGWLIVSGLLADEWEEVRARVSAEGLRFDEVDADEGWCSGLFRRPP